MGSNAVAGSDNNFSNSVSWRYGFERINAFGRDCGRCDEPVYPAPPETFPIENGNITEQVLRNVKGVGSNTRVPTCSCGSTRKTGRKCKECGGAWPWTWNTEKRRWWNNTTLAWGNENWTAPGAAVAADPVVEAEIAAGVGPRQEYEKEYLVYTPGVTIPEGLRFLAETQGDSRARLIIQAMKSIPRFLEENPGCFLGTDVNKILLPDPVGLRVDVYGNIFGGPSSEIVQRRVDQLNGFQETVNAFIYERGTPGSAGQPFVKDNFLIDIGSSLQHPWTQRIRRLGLGISLWINGTSGRTIYLVRRREPYYFTFRLPTQNPLFPPNGNAACIDICEHAFYFSTDPIGGGARSPVNIGPLAEAEYEPKALADFQLFAGNTGYLCVDNSFPDVFFYGSRYSPWLGGVCIVLGSYP
jgi:hypothetical protein